MGGWVTLRQKFAAVLRSAPDTPLPQVLAAAEGDFESNLPTNQPNSQPTPTNQLNSPPTPTKQPTI